MHQAMQERSLDPALIERLNQSFFNTADWMRNK
jgi:hemoglobin